MNEPLSKTDLESAAAAAAGQTFTPTPAQTEEIKSGVSETLERVMPILKIDMRPTNVDPATHAGRRNMRRVLNAIMNDESAKITVKDDSGNSVGVAAFRQIYPQIHGPADDGSIQVEYHEQATLGTVGDSLWAINWFFKHGILGLPRQMTKAVLQAAGATFLLERYYQRWLISLLDQLNQQGVLPGYVDPETHQDNWEVVTATVGQNIIVRPRMK